MEETLSMEVSHPFGHVTRQFHAQLPGQRVTAEDQLFQVAAIDVLNYDNHRQTHQKQENTIETHTNETEERETTQTSHVHFRFHPSPSPLSSFSFFFFFFFCLVPRLIYEPRAMLI